jgi:hypothetical protein
MYVRVLTYAAALLAFWSGAICLGRGALWIFFVLAVSYVSHAALNQHCSVHHVVRFTYVAADSSMVPAALLACLNLLFYIHSSSSLAHHACTECNYDNQRPLQAWGC